MYADKNHIAKKTVLKEGKKKVEVKRVYCWWRHTVYMSISVPFSVHLRKLSVLNS